MAYPHPHCSSTLPNFPLGQPVNGGYPYPEHRERLQDELMADWDLAVHGQQPYKIEPLR